ncbi:MAG: glycosyltransferase family 4 protein [candidate division WOR-3 bacterium]|jgi:phosphatidylinositol alpha-mannosyltransferase|nr:glycosyltransferase family 4 protein [candidate division WOR-3 bacterium]MDH7518482.1 glycosyltransferase family 4 protein [bacterium]
MRICLVSSAYRPYISGVGEHVHHLARELQNLGHSVHILTTSYTSFPDNGAFPATRLGKGLLLPFAQGQFTLPFKFNLPLATKKFFAANRFDIVHCHGIFPPELAYWAAHYTKDPLVVTFHTVTPELPNIVCKTVGFLLKKLDRKIKVKIAVSHGCQLWAEKFFTGDFRIIPNGVDIDRFHPDIPPLLNENRPLILFVGRLEKRKGLDTLLRALPEVIRHYPRARLVVVGYGPLKNYYRKVTVDIGVNQAVTFLDAVPNDLLPNYYTSATVYVAPTIGKEAMGIVLIEALSCARPVVASDIPGYNEIVTNGVNGILVPPGNHQALAQAIITVLDSEKLRRQLSCEARARARDFDWKKIGPQVAQVYQEVINR